MLAFEITVKNFNKLDALSQRLVLPLVAVGKKQLRLLQTRVLTGKDPTGADWSPLGGSNKGVSRRRMNGAGDRRGRRDGRDLWWVGPRHPQPPGWYFEITSSPESNGRFVGWKVYRNYREYLELSRHGNRRDWHRTGTFWASVGVRARNARQVTVGAFGSRLVDGKRVRNRDIGRLAGIREKFGVFTYSDAERAQAVASVKASIDEQMAMRAGQVAELGRVSARLKTANRRTSKLLGG